MDYETDGEIYPNSNVEKKYQTRISCFIQINKTRFKRLYARYLLLEDGTIFSLIRNDFLLIYDKTKSGRKIVQLNNKWYMTDTLVATHFVFNPDPESLTEIWHKNGNIEDNSYLNLQWTTEQELRELRTDLFMLEFMKNNSNLRYKEFHLNSNYLIFDHGEIFSKYSCSFINKQSRSDNDYFHVTLTTNKKKKYKIHRLVAEAFIENTSPNSKLEVDHINRIRKDNRVENLRWVTSSENKLNMDFTNFNKRAVLQISIETGEVIQRYKTTVEALSCMQGNKHKIEGKFLSKIDNKMYLWSYESPIETIKVPEGFYPLKIDPEYFISKSGQVYSTFKRSIMKLQTNSNGYYYLNLKQNMYLIHRITLENFMENKPENYNSLFINHKNGIKKDNRLENLEYVTPAENARHSIHVLGNLSKHINCYDIKTGEIIKFISVAACVSHFKMSSRTIFKYMKDKCQEDELFRGRYQFELDTDPFVINTDSYKIEAN